MGTKENLCLNTVLSTGAAAEPQLGENREGLSLKRRLWQILITVSQPQRNPVHKLSASGQNLACACSVFRSA